MSLEVPPHVQFPRRVLRSTINKLMIAINRQLIVMSSEPEKASLFEGYAREIFLELLGPLEAELYSLCDSVEALGEM